MLSDEQKFKLAIAWYYDAEDWEINKAIAVIEEAESIATAPLLARIAELEAGDEEALEHQEWWNSRMLELERENAELVKALAEARKDAMHAAALICDALPAPPSCNVLERNLWDVATVAAADAIRAAIKEQT